MPEPQTDLETLLALIDPHLIDVDYVFCSVSEEQYKSLSITPLCTFREDEGVSVILEKAVADTLPLKYDGTWSLITCRINSDLAAVGFLSKLSTALADREIAMNAVSAFYHDHLFVPCDRAKEALAVLEALSINQRNQSSQQTLLNLANRS